MKTCLQHGYAQGTVRNYTNYWQTYLAFCEYFGIKALPIRHATLCYFIVYLRQVISPDTIINYLSALRAVQNYYGFSIAEFSHMSVKLVLNTAKRVASRPPKHAAPITVDILLDIYKTLDLKLHRDIAFWTATLFGFFALLRKSNIVPPSAKTFDPEKHLNRGSIADNGQFLTLHITWSKTLQFRNTVIEAPLPDIRDYRLSPAFWYRRMVRLTPAPPQAPAFVYHINGHLATFTHSSYTRKLRACLHQAGYPAANYTGHSLRRGGATVLHQLGFEVSDIMLLGDWQSDSVLRYIDRAPEARKMLSRKFGLGVLAQLSATPPR